MSGAGPGGPILAPGAGFLGAAQVVRTSAVRTAVQVTGSGLLPLVRLREDRLPPASRLGRGAIRRTAKSSISSINRSPLVKQATRKSQVTVDCSRSVGCDAEVVESLRSRSVGSRWDGRVEDPGAGPGTARSPARNGNGIPSRLSQLSGNRCWPLRDLGDSIGAEGINARRTEKFAGGGSKSRQRGPRRRAERPRAIPGLSENHRKSPRETAVVER